MDLAELVKRDFNVLGSQGRLSSKWAGGAGIINVIFLLFWATASQETLTRILQMNTINYICFITFDFPGTDLAMWVHLSGLVLGI